MSAIDLVERVIELIMRGALEGDYSKIEEGRDTITRLQAALEWQPIETAPRDGTWVLSWCARDGHGLARYMGYTSLTDDENWSGATHWMPLPEPPAISSVGGE